MTKRLVDIQDDLLEQARAALGTETIKDTVATALTQAVLSDRRRRQVDDAALDLFAAATSDLGDPDVMSAAWQ